ncbi:SusC/RagA family TonB-linked outer membrane protein [Adhaeribacter radiodurans]|uniref:SusC/RagA family TonB-linked outer membrane protein n=1 Tax=Adhaeribacter radiodurans TaxID=2745197 RepID=A0A7L7L682_9BACT|nr:SusC/RagA family TonB-linked outer membrane protein [Adhaeribacter radiodurans]QMU28264.1 SusC/RagA family TonB-linked outer membrane protein [Adhaeribacter radiodurans]
MLKKALQLILLLLTLCQLPVLAQDDRITGKVTGAENEGLPGVSIQVSGTNQGTVTDAEGNFTINAPGNATLVFSYIGYTNQTVNVNNRSIINVTLSSDTKALDEVVVTALGIKREAKTLGYATATVNADQIAVNRTPNVMSGLQGKMAGVNISTMATGPGGTSKIRIRGQSSFSGQNSPLIVINGVPVDNSNYALGGNFGNRIANNSDGGDGLQSINPDDIESMTVLKGATAAALYGSRAKDGVVMITTKSKGEGQGLGIEYNTNLTTETPLDFSDFQYEYGQGEGGVRPQAPNPLSGVWSFGEKFQPGMTQILFDGETWPYEPVRNRIRKFYNVGTNFTNTVRVSNNGANGGFSLSFANLDSKSIVPNSKFNRKTINLGFNQNISKKLSTSGNLNYSNEYNKNPAQINGQEFATPTVVMTLANSMPFEALEQNQLLPNGYEFPFARFLVRNNPYYAVNQHFENIRRDRLFGNIALKYQFTDWLYLQGRIAQDYYSRDQDYNVPNGYAAIAPAPVGFINGSYTQDVRRFRERNYDFILGANRTFGDIGVDVTLGGNTRYVRMDYNSVTVQDFIQPGLYTVMNGRVKNPFYSLSERKVNSLYGAATFSFREFLYLNVTARNDWFSTLAPQNRSILYPSVTGSFVFSQAFESLPAWLSFGKLRAAYAEVGDDNVAPYSNALYYSVNNNLFPNPSGQVVPVGGINATTIPNPNLKPLRVAEAEVGLELKLFNNFLGFDIAYYRKITNDQILAAQVSDASSYTNRLINVGKSMNKGVEMLISAAPVNTPSFRWDVSFNASYNTSEVLTLGLNAADTMIVVGGSGGTTLRQVVGQPIGQLYTFSYLRDDQGRQVFNKTSGTPLRGGLVNAGSALPKYFGGITNTFTYKGVSLSTLIDFKLGHKMIGGSNMNYLRHGLHKRTLVGREEGYVIGQGVNPDGEVNTTRSPVQPFYEWPNANGVFEDFVYNAGFWKLRQITLSYDFTKMLPEKFFIKGLKFSAVANNVAVLKKWTENMDPEQVNNASDNQTGLDFWPSLPLTRSLGFNLNVKF